MKKIKILSIVMMVLVSGLALGQGYTRISSQLKQKNDLAFPLVDSYDLLGGAVSGTERTALPQERRQQGMLFLDTDDDMVYQLVGGTADVNWQKFTSGGNWSRTDNNIIYDEGTVTIGLDLHVGKAKIIGQSGPSNGLRIGNQDGDNLGSNILLGLNHELGAGWDIFQSDLSGALGNVFIGIDNIYQATITGDYNIAIGKWTGYNLTTGGDNVYLGRSSGEKNPDGWYNVSLGNLAGVRGGGSWNIDIGQRAGYGYNLLSSKNINIGLSAGLIYGTPGGQTGNISIGEYAGWHFKGDSTVMIGVNAGVEADGTKNYMIGYSAGRESLGNVNLYLGRDAGRNHTGDSCVFIGDGVGYLFNGSKRILMDVMYRPDASYMIDLQGATNKRIATFRAKQSINKVDTFYVRNLSGSLDKLKIFKRSDSTIITGDYPIKIDGVSLSLNDRFSQNGLQTIAHTNLIGDDSQIVLSDGITGWGQVQIGDNEEFTQFRFSSDGTIELFNSSTNVAATDTDAYLCLINTGSGIAIKNRLGSSKTLRYSIHYSN